jgi:ferritin-like metal-binding protein YciE
MAPASSFSRSSTKSGSDSSSAPSLEVESYKVEHMTLDSVGYGVTRVALQIIVAGKGASARKLPRFLHQERKTGEKTAWVSSRKTSKQWMTSSCIRCATSTTPVQSLPEMVHKSSDPQLKQVFQAHLGESKNHVTRLEQVFKLHGQQPGGVDCPAIDGIIDEAEEIAGEVENKSVLDAALIAAARAVEHYEITRYGTLIAWAKELGRNDCAALLQQNLEKEKAADQKLTAWPRPT